MFQSIRVRLIFSYLFLTLCTVATLGLVGTGLVQRYVLQQERDFLEANAQAIARQAAFYMQGAEDEAGLERLAQSAAFIGDLNVQIFGNEDRLLVAASGATAQAGLTWIPDTLSGVAPRGEEESLFIFSLRPNTALHELGALRRQQLLPAQSGEFLTSGATDELLTIRRAPSFWGSRLSFEPLDLEELLTSEHFADDAGGVAVMISPPHTATVSTIPASPVTPSTQTRFAQAWEPGTGRPDWGSRLMRMGYENAVAPIRSSENESGAEFGIQYGYVSVSRATNIQAEPLAALRNVFLLAAAGAIGLATLIGLAVSRGLTSPIQTLSHAANRMAAGDLSSRAPLESKDELGALAQRFNEMATQLQSNFDALEQERDTLRRFVADASHELRTPLTAIRTFTELLQGNAGSDPGQRAEFLQESLAQIARLNWLTDNLLNLSRLDAGVANLELAPHTVAELIGEATAGFREQARQAGVELIVEADEPSPTLVCDAGRLEMALRNLVDNALKFTPSGGQIRLGYSEETTPATGQAVVIWVADTGVGIDPEELPFIFQRFFRSTRTRREGSGLGLAIVQSVAQAHSGTVSVNSEPGQGSRFEIRLPLQPPAQDVRPV